MYGFQIQVHSPLAACPLPASALSRRWELLLGLPVPGQACGAGRGSAPADRGDGEGDGKVGGRRRPVSADPAQRPTAHRPRGSRLCLPGLVSPLAFVAVAEPRWLRLGAAAGFAARGGSVRTRRLLCQRKRGVRFHILKFPDCRMLFFWNSLFMDFILLIR